MDCMVGDEQVGKAYHPESLGIKTDISGTKDQLNDDIEMLNRLLQPLR